MSSSTTDSWMDNPYAPNITHNVYIGEKDSFAGNLIGAIFYGIVIALFFQCMAALLNPANRKKGTKWGFVAYASAMFTFVTVYTAMNLNLYSISYIDNRAFPGVDGGAPGPLGYQKLVVSKAISVIPNTMFPFNQWLADGLLLYRCYVLYSMNVRVIAFPCTILFASTAMGIVLIYHQAMESRSQTVDISIPYFTVSLLLNVLLTGMVVIRLIQNSGDIQEAVSPRIKPSRLYRAIVTILVESSALYAVGFILYIGPRGAGSAIQLIFFPILAQIQVIASLLIITRVANHTAVTTSVIGSQNVIHLSQEKSTTDRIDGRRPVGTIRFVTSTVDVDSQQSEI